MEKLEKKIEELMHSRGSLDEDLRAIAQETKDIAIAFAKKINGHSLTFTNLEKEYNKFIDNYYK